MSILHSKWRGREEQQQAKADVAYEAGYYDQAHLTRSLQRFIGQTPAGIARGEQQLSLLYNKQPAPFATV